MSGNTVRTNSPIREISLFDSQHERLYLCGKDESKGKLQNKLGTDVNALIQKLQKKKPDFFAQHSQRATHLDIRLTSDELIVRLMEETSPGKLEQVGENLEITAGELTSDSSRILEKTNRIFQKCQRNHPARHEGKAHSHSFADRAVTNLTSLPESDHLHRHETSKPKRNVVREGWAKELEEAEAQIADIEASKQSRAQASIDHLKKQNKRLTKDSKSATRAFEKERRQYEAGRADLERRLEASQQERDELSAKSEQQRAELLKLAEENKKVAKGWKHIRHLEDVVDANNAALALQKRDIQVLTKQNAAQGKKIHALKAKRQELTGNLQNLGRQLEEHQSKLDQALAKSEKQKELIAKLTGNLTKSLAEIDALEEHAKSDATAAKKKLEATRAELAKAQEEHRSSQAASATQKDKISTLTEERKKLEEKQAGLEDQLAAAKKESAETQTTIAQQKAQLAQQRDLFVEQVEQAESDAAAAEKRVKKRDSTIALQGKQLQALTKQNAAQGEKIHALEAQRQELTGNLQNLGRQLEEHQSKLDQALAKSEKQKEHIAKLTDNLTKSLAEINALEEHANSDATAAKKNLEATRAELAKAQEELRSSQAASATQKDKISTLTEERKKLEEKQAGLEGQLAAAQKESAEAQITIAQQNAQLAQQRELFVEQVEQAESDAAAAEKKVKKRDSTIALQEKQIQDLTARNDAYSTEISALRTQNAQLERKVTDLESQVEANQQALTTAEKKLADATAAHKKEHNHLQLSLLELEEGHDQLCYDTKEALDAKDAATAALTRAWQERNSRLQAEILDLTEQVKLHRKEQTALRAEVETSKQNVRAAEEKLAKTVFKAKNREARLVESYNELDNQYTEMLQETDTARQAQAAAFRMLGNAQKNRAESLENRISELEEQLLRLRNRHTSLAQKTAHKDQLYTHLTSAADRPATVPVSTEA